MHIYTTSPQWLNAKTSRIRVVRSASPRRRREHAYGAVLQREHDPGKSRHPTVKVTVNRPVQVPLHHEVALFHHVQSRHKFSCAAGKSWRRRRELGCENDAIFFFAFWPCTTMHHSPHAPSTNGLILAYSLPILPNSLYKSGLRVLSSHLLWDKITKRLTVGLRPLSPQRDAYML